MNAARKLAGCVLLLVTAAGVGASLLAPSPYEAQDRDHVSARPSPRLPLGTDELGRDRFSRLLYGLRVSLLLAPSAALISLGIAGVLGILSAHWGGWRERAVLSATDLVMSLPWLFLMLTLRAVLPLNLSPWLSVVVTFALLAVVGWAASARVIHARVRALRSADFVLQARASGCAPKRLMLAHMLPNLRPVIFAQFWVLIPAFLLSEANLGLLGLGVAEPLPSLGNLLRELENLSALRTQPWLLAPAFLLLVVVSCFQAVLSNGEETCA